MVKPVYALRLVNLKPTLTNFTAVMSKTVDMIRVEKYFLHFIRADMYMQIIATRHALSCRVENASH